LADTDPGAAGSYIEAMTGTHGLEPELNPVLAQIESKTGPNNFLRVMAQRPEAMESFVRFYDSLMGSGSLLDPRLKEMVYLAVSFVNEASYCGSRHTIAAHDAGLSEEEISAIELENNQHFSAREQAALHYAREVTRTASVDDDTRYRAQELFSDPEFIELTLIVALANFTNRFSNALAVSPHAARSMG
jgi:uncharacterized peroxidase-related enzyme